jgi:peptidoglycan/xylan/chitin deacetylase (PgdA/CDA1 family)
METIKSLAYGLGALAGVPRLFHRTLVSDGATILMYHAVTHEPLRVMDWAFVQERRFRDQMLYLKRHCRVVPLRDLPAAIHAGARQPVVALTFDDGFQNNYSVAFPILRELDLPATIFLATDFVDSDETPWFCRVNDALSRTSKERLEWDGQTYDLSTARSRAETHAQLQLEMKKFKPEALVERTVQLAAELGDCARKSIPRGSPYRMLETHEIREMAATGLMEFGAHGCSHSVLSGLAESERKREIITSIAAVERLAGSRCRLFAYPNGRVSDYGPSDLAALRENEITAAVTTVAGPNYPSVPPLEMRRYCIGAGTPLSQFKLMTHHVLWKLRN